MLIYVPLEPYEQRYTSQLSRAKDGWFERQLIKHGVSYTRVEGNAYRKEIKYGSVLDAIGRSMWALDQVKNLLIMLDKGLIQHDDTIYFEDFWHPGIEALAYAKDLMKLKFNMFALLHAQSIDIYDFTYPMRGWMRHFEKGIGKILSGVFVTSTCLYDLVQEHGIGEPYITGLPYCSEEVLFNYPHKGTPKKNQVIFSSRLDKEKNPNFFLHVIDWVYAHCETLGISGPHFVYTTSSKELRSNDDSVIPFLKHYEKLGLLELRIGQTKDQYYRNLAESKVQFNCANQDFVSWTLLEATTFDCVPIYPNYRSFPEIFRDKPKYLYEHLDVASAGAAIMRGLSMERAGLNEIYEPFDNSVYRMLQVMGFKPASSSYDPFGNPLMYNKRGWFK